MATTPERGTSGRFTSLFKKDGVETAGEIPPGDNTSPGSAAIGEARAEAATGLEQRRGRGRPRKESGASEMAVKPSAAQPGSASRIPPEVLEQMERLYSPEIWEPFVELPAAAMMTLTGHDHWAIDDKEKRVLSVSVSTAARYMGFTNPKWLAINLALINLMTVYAPRALKEFALRKLEKAAQKKPVPESETK